MASTADMVSKIIRDRIISGEFKPGERLREVELCKQLEISRTPLREAFRILQSQGFLSYQSNSGVIVTPFSLEEVLELQDVRYVLEPLSARCAAEHITREQLQELEIINEQILEVGKTNLLGTTELDIRFHTLIVRAGKNSVLIEHLSAIYRRVTMMGNLLPIRQDRLPHTYREHSDMIYALSIRDPELAGKYAGIHFYASRKSFNKKASEYVLEQEALTKK